MEHVAYLTSPEQIAEYMRSFRDSRWPNGMLAEPQPARDHNTKMRTRVACKAKLFGNLSGELTVSCLAALWLFSGSHPLW